jgi:predicted N-acetyltransferase YhbS
MRWHVRELAAAETHDLRRRVSADGRTDLPSLAHPLDEAPGVWHLGATDESGRVVAIASYYPLSCPWRPGAEPAVQLQNMAVEPSLQRSGAGSAVMAEAIRRLRATDAVLLWAHARDNAIPFYERFGFAVVEGSGGPVPRTGRPHHDIVLDLTAD